MSLLSSSLVRMTMKGHVVDEIDPLDAFMATLNSDASVQATPSTTTVDARAAARAYRGVQSSPATAVSVTVRNRRYTRLQQLLEKTAPENADDWYFSDEMMQQRNPALYHLHLGQYLNVASRQQRAPTGGDGITLSTFLMETCDRQVMEARRVQEQRTWGNYRSVDDTQEEEEVEEEDEEDDSDEETKESEEDTLVDARREQLIELMGQRFLDGYDSDFVDYAAIDADQALDDMDQMQRDAEERYFDMDE